ncbi:hypothetical protein VNO77_03749 [Canavalia gladiata]|uniref:Uncharacterized protein n=1 Tax=Canavalia gladiata TaxID=3824 RepID=A0AAN9MV87_CANGL
MDRTKQMTDNKASLSKFPRKTERKLEVESRQTSLEIEVDLLKSLGGLASGFAGSHGLGEFYDRLATSSTACGSCYDMQLNNHMKEKWPARGSNPGYLEDTRGASATRPRS